ncbi:MAG TPA: hypothetical protein VGC54_12025 [Planctomycetota bacterium]
MPVKNYAEPVPAAVDPTSDGPARWLVAACMVGLVLHAVRYLDVVQEEAYLYFRYAENFARGAGLVFNAGEHVEGHSSTLWALLLGLIGKTGLAIPEAARWLGMLFAALALVPLWRIARFFGARPFAAVLAPALLVVSPAYALAASSGLETGLFLCLLFAAAAAYLCELQDAQFRPWWSAIWLVLLALARPEGVWIGALFFVHAGLHLVFFDKTWSLKYQHLIRLAAWALAGGLLLLLRANYYGSFVAQVQTMRFAGQGPLFGDFALGQIGHGWDRYLRPFLAQQVFLFGWGLLLVVAALPRLAKQSGFWLAVLLAAAGMAWSLRLGGDESPMWRLLLPVHGLAVACIAAAVFRVSTYPRSRGPGMPAPQVLRILVVVTMVVGGVNLLQVDQDWKERLDVGRVARASSFHTYEQLKGVIPPGEVIAFALDGVMPWVMIDNPVLDLSGACEPHLAAAGRRALPQLGHADDHWQKADIDWVVRTRKPKWILVQRAHPEFGRGPWPASTESVTDDRGRPWSVSFTHPVNQLVANHALFRLEYELVSELQNLPEPAPTFAGGASRRLFVYRRKSG